MKRLVTIVFLTLSTISMAESQSIWDDLRSTVKKVMHVNATPAPEIHCEIRGARKYCWFE